MNIEHCSKNMEWKWMSDIYFDTVGQLLQSWFSAMFTSPPPVKTGGYLQATPTEL